MTVDWEKAVITLIVTSDFARDAKPAVHVASD